MNARRLTDTHTSFRLACCCTIEQGFESDKVIEVLKKLNYRGAK